MYRKASILVLIFSVLAGTSLQAQLKTQITSEPSVEQRIQIPGLEQNSLSLNLFDASRFSMHHSYSMSAGTFGGGAFSSAMYLNKMSYVFSDKLMMNARVGFMHDPLKLGDNSLQMSNPMENLIYGADITYRPKENLLLRISYDHRPASYYYGNNGYYSRGYMSPFAYQYLLGY